MNKLRSFPHITPAEFSSACASIQARFERNSDAQSKWLSAEVLPHVTTPAYLSITKALPDAASSTPSAHEEESQNEVEEDQDDNALITNERAQAVVEYDIILSPSYQVPVLYINIQDPLHRYPPTMPILYKHIIPPQYKDQAEKAGIIGGITVTDHPLTNKPVFFIHPCHTAAVIQASISGKEQGVTGFEYLMIWIGAFGGCVGLDVPVEIVAKGDVLARGTT
jgi:ubiquitin-like-conjugating enzyme ATG10